MSKPHPRDGMNRADIGRACSEVEWLCTRYGAAFAKTKRLDENELAWAEHDDWQSAGDVDMRVVHKLRSWSPVDGERMFCSLTSNYSTRFLIASVRLALARAQDIAPSNRIETTRRAHRAPPATSYHRARGA